MLSTFSRLPLRKKASFSAASAQLRSCRKASQKLHKSRWYWHLRKSRLLHRAAKKAGFYEALTQLCGKAAKKPAFLQLLRSFYAELCKNSHDEQKLPCEKKLAFLQLLRSSEAAEKLRKSQRYWHLRKSRLLPRAAKKPAFTKLLRNSAEKLQKSRLFYSFYEAFTQSFVKIVMMSKSCGNAAITQVPIPPAFAKLLHAAFMQTCIKAAFLQLLCKPALKLRFYSFNADLRKSCVKPAFLQLLRRSA